MFKHYTPVKFEWVGIVAMCCFLFKIAWKIDDCNSFKWTFLKKKTEHFTFSSTLFVCYDLTVVRCVNWVVPESIPCKVFTGNSGLPRVHTFLGTSTPLGIFQWHFNESYGCILRNWTLCHSEQETGNKFGTCYVLLTERSHTAECWPKVKPVQTECS